jgi:hypothetical protein
MHHTSDIYGWGFVRPPTLCLLSCALRAESVAFHLSLPSLSVILLCSFCLLEILCGPHSILIGASCRGTAPNDTAEVH